MKAMGPRKRLLSQIAIITSFCTEFETCVKRILKIGEGMTFWKSGFRVNVYFKLIRVYFENTDYCEIKIKNEELVNTIVQEEAEKIKVTKYKSNDPNQMLEHDDAREPSPTAKEQCFIVIPKKDSFDAMTAFKLMYDISSGRFDSFRESDAAKVYKEYKFIASGTIHDNPDKYWCPLFIDNLYPDGCAEMMKATTIMLYKKLSQYKDFMVGDYFVRQEKNSIILYKLQNQKQPIQYGSIGHATTRSGEPSKTLKCKFPTESLEIGDKKTYYIRAYRLLVFIRQLHLINLICIRWCPYKDISKYISSVVLDCLFYGVELDKELKKSQKYDKNKGGTILMGIPGINLLMQNGNVVAPDNAIPEQ